MGTGSPADTRSASYGSLRGFRAPRCPGCENSLFVMVSCSERGPVWGFMSGALVEDLKAELARGRVVVLVGAGVSAGATGGAPVASWTGLLENGVARCEELAL